MICFFVIHIHSHTPTELFVRMMMVMMCNDILHDSFVFDATKVNYLFQINKDLSQKVYFSYQISGNISSGSTSQ